MKSDIPVVGVFGHYGNRNLGDESLVATTIDNLRSRLPGVKIICMSLRPCDTASRYGVESYEIRRIKGLAGPVLPGIPTNNQSLPWEKSSQKQNSVGMTDTEDTGSTVIKVKNWLKALPYVGRLIKLALLFIHLLIDVANELAFLFRSYKYLKKFDLVIVAGSNQLFDFFGGAWGFPYTLFKWAILAKVTGTKLAFVSVGAGPIDRYLSKLFLQIALRFAEYISYRDEPSRALIESRIGNRSGLVYPDLAHGIDFKEKSKSTQLGIKPVVGINPMPYFDSRYWFVSDSQRYLKFVTELAGFVDKLIENKYPIFFFGTMWRDYDSITDIVDAISEENKEVVEELALIRECEHIEELMDAIQQADIILATRFHGAVLSFRAGRPVLGLCYHSKVEDIIIEMGQNNYQEPIDSFTANSLWQRFLELEGQLPTEVDKIKAKGYEYRLLLSEQWDQIVKLAI